MGQYLVKIRYERQIASIGYVYSREQAVEAFRSRHREIKPSFAPKREGEINVFWIGTNKNQDLSGFLQALEELAQVTVYVNPVGDYGIRSGHFLQGTSAQPFELVKQNDEMILRALSNAHEKSQIDVCIGQMLANYISDDAIKSMRDMGIPVLNISMDDRLPENWASKNGRRMGSIGLANSLDMVLTTSDETCAWYGVSGCPAIYWPLASSKDLFFERPESERDIDVLFIGNRYGARGPLIEEIERQGVRLECYGAGWPNGSLDYAEMANLSRRSKIIFGISAIGNCDDRFTLKLRDFDSVISGALYMTNDNEDLRRLFVGDKEVVYYSSAVEAANKILLYLGEHEMRLDVAGRGQKKALQLHEWKVRLRTTFQDIGLMLP